MAIRDDVLVVGGGLAGMAAALGAAEAGAAVRLLSHKESTLRQASGLVDVLGYTPDGEVVADPLAALTGLPESHPYRRVGAGAVRDALDLFDDVAGDRYAGAHTSRNALVPTHGGTVKPTARYPTTVAPGVASDDRPALLVGFEALPDFDAELAAAHLRNAGVPFDIEGVTVPFPGAFQADTKVTRYAGALVADERLEGATTRAALTDRIARHLGDAKRVGLPPILGETAADAAAVRADLAERLGADVFEIPAGPPSLPGMRLEAAFREAIEAAGVRVTTGVPAVGHETEGDRLVAVAVERSGRVPYRAEQFVLATGGLVGKGIDSNRGGVRESVFDCHVPHPDDRYDWFADDAFGDHPFPRFGVDHDDELRPRDPTGDPEYPNLRAAGAVLGGYDFAAEKSGAGVSLATGLYAGRRAGERV